VGGAEGGSKEAVVKAQVGKKTRGVSFGNKRHRRFKLAIRLVKEPFKKKFFGMRARLAVPITSKNFRFPNIRY